jgi:hypothetical protein
LGCVRKLLRRCAAKLKKIVFIRRKLYGVMLRRVVRREPEPSGCPLLERDYGVSETGLYIVRFNEPALASYTGGIAGLAATSPEATGERRLDANSPAAVAYTDYLNQRHSEFTATMEQTLNRSVEVAFDYTAALNGMAVRVSHEEAAKSPPCPAFWPSMATPNVNSPPTLAPISSARPPFGTATPALA